MSIDHGASYDAAVRAAEDAYTAVYEAAAAEHGARVRASEAQLEEDVAAAREARDAAVVAANSEYRSALGIGEPDLGMDLPADLVEKFDGDVAASEEGTA